MFSDLPTFDASEQLTTPILVPMSPPPLGTIHILCKHIFQLFGPPPFLHKHDFRTENKQF